MKMSMYECITLASDLTRIIDYKELTKYLLKKIDEKKAISGEDDMSVERIVLILCTRLAFKEYEERKEKEYFEKEFNDLVVESKEEE